MAVIVFKELKKNSKSSLKKNYLFMILACFIGLIFLSLYTSTRSAFLTGLECVQNFFENGRFATNSYIDYMDSGLPGEDIDYNAVYDLSEDELKSQGYNAAAIRYIKSLNPEIEDKQSLVERLKIRDGIAKPLLSLAGTDLNVIYYNIEDITFRIISGEFDFQPILLSALGIIAIIAYRFFFINVLEVGYARFFLENTKYHKTRLGAMFKCFSKGYLKTALTMFKRTVYQSLWNFTIIGGIIKLYSYKLVPFIVAEDSTISSGKAITLSRKLMKGNKWRAFWLDCTFMGWNILSGLTFGLVGIFFSNPYMQGTMAEFYKAIIKDKKAEGFYKKYLGEREYIDEKLYVGEDEDYYGGIAPSQNSFAMQNYSPLALVSLFFVCAFAGWCMEVLLFLLKTHTFVNRGTLLGPWLPIYGFGCVLIIIAFTKTKLKKNINNPVVIFLNVMLLCGILEYTTSWFLEMTTGLKYWDYAGHLLNINGRICFENLCEFGLGGLLCIYLLAPNLNKVITKIDKKKLIVILTIVLVIFATDFIYSGMHPRVGYGITESIIDEEGNVIGKSGEKT